ncbi:MAG: endonuclease/exonuclease/phosphatase family protein [Rikenellaceae bacterium]
MKKISVFVFALLLVLQSCTEPMEVTMMCYNVRGCRSDSGVIDYDRFVDVISKYDVDFVSLQELDSVTVRSNHTSNGHELAQRLDMEFTFASAIDFSGGKYGIGLLSREKPISTIKIYLPSQSERRALLIAEFEDIYMGVTHLPLSDEERVEAIRLIKLQVDGLNDKPLVLSGDFNAEPTSEPIIEICKDFTPLSSFDEFTFSANNPTVTIDYVFGYNNGYSFDVKSYEVLQAKGVSDHLPLLISFQVK